MAETDKYVFLEFELPAELINKPFNKTLVHEFLDNAIYHLKNSVKIPRVGYEGKGIIVSSKRPEWKYYDLLLILELIEYFKFAPWVAVYYPELNKAIVMKSNTNKYKYGDAIHIDYGKLKFIEY